MSNELKEGLKLKNILGRPVGENENSFFEIGKEDGHRGKITSIIVRNQMGQMAMVPWARIDYDSGAVIMFNLDAAELVELDPRKEQPT